MARTTTERLISRDRKSAQLLVPMIEHRLRQPCEVEDQDDINFINDLISKGIEREKQRRGKRVYSPSMLSSCLRQVYLARHYRELGIIPLRQTRIEPNFYFLTGDWLHIKWQFVLYKMHKEKTEGFTLIDTEVFVLSKHGDHGGTIDAVCEVGDETVAVDFKGLNTRSFMQAVKGDVDLQYKVQLADYLMLWNSNYKMKTKLDRGLIIVENKGGPDPNHPVALTEITVRLEDHRPEILWRLESLRGCEEEQTIPAPSCQSVNSIQFQGCAFRKHCRDEIKEIQKRNAKSGNTEKFRVASPNGKRSTRAGRTNK